jgi:HlyD family secretion protein
VFLIRDGEVLFTPVTVGITGQEHFEVRSGVEAGDTIVAGPYQTIRQLDDGDPVTPADANEGRGAGDVGT